MDHRLEPLVAASQGADAGVLSPRIAVLIPCYNEAEVLPLLHDRSNAVGVRNGSSTQHRRSPMQHEQEQSLDQVQLHSRTSEELPGDPGVRRDEHSFVLANKGHKLASSLSVSQIELAAPGEKA